MALIEFMKELKGIQGARPISDEELAMTKDALMQRLLGTFGSVNGIDDRDHDDLAAGPAGRLLPAVRARRSRPITREDVLRVAKQYVDLDHLAIVIVGDRKSIEAGLKATGIAPMVMVEDVR